MKFIDWEEKETYISLHFTIFLISISVSHLIVLKEVWCEVWRVQYENRLKVNLKKKNKKKNNNNNNAEYTCIM